MLPLKPFYQSLDLAPVHPVRVFVLQHGSAGVSNCYNNRVWLLWFVFACHVIMQRLAGYLQSRLDLSFIDFQYILFKISLLTGPYLALDYGGKLGRSCCLRSRDLSESLRLRTVLA